MFVANIGQEGRLLQCSERPGTKRLTQNTQQWAHTLHHQPQRCPRVLYKHTQVTSTTTQNGGSKQTGNRAVFSKKNMHSFVDGRVVQKLLLFAHLLFSQKISR